jgi:hypothetical protein
VTVRDPDHVAAVLDGARQHDNGSGHTTTLDQEQI